MNWRRTGILAVFDLRHSLLRLKGLLFLIPFALFWYWMLKSLFENNARHLVSTEGLAVTTLLFNAEIAQNLLIFNPPSLSVFFMIVVSTTPFFAMLAANNPVAGDAGRRTFRYFLTRATRTEVLLGRFLSNYLLFAAGMVIIALIATFISLQNDGYNVTETIAYAVEITALSLLYILPFVTFMIMVSALMGSAMSTLLAAVVLYFVLLVLGTYLNQYLPFEISLVPSGIKNHLFNIHPQDPGYAIAGSACYTLIYGMTGWWLFQRRNI